MPALFVYLLKLSLSLGIVFLFYQLVLRKLTFYNSNRWYLLGYSLFCFFIPFIDVSTVLQKNEWATSRAVKWVPVIGEYKANEIIADPAYHFFTVWNNISLVLIAGMLIMFIRLLFQLISFRRMIKKAKVIPGEGMNLFQVDEEIIPFSFGNSIFINQRLHSNEELQEIIRHEFVHVKQKHSIDIIWGELLCLVNWYNPFAWLLKRSIRQNLEFIADSKVLENGINKKQYQYLLLKVTGNNQYSIAPKFNFSSLKKRIAMMNRLKTARVHLVRFLFILPLLAIILVSFRKQIRDTITNSMNKGIVTGSTNDFTDTVPDVKELNDKGYYIDIKEKAGHRIVVVKDKAGKEVERVLLTKWKENSEKYENLYGEILPPPPPLPPVPPVPPVPPTPPVPIKLPANVTSINVNNNKATVKLKNGSKENYDLSIQDQKETFEKKYGKMPEPPNAPTRPALPLSNQFPDFVKTFKTAPDYIEVWLKNGKKERYDLKVPSQKEAFEKKYGELPEAPEPPERPEQKEKPEPPEKPELPSPRFSKEETIRMNKQAENRANVSNDFEITDRKAVLHLKNGVTEEYDLTVKEQRRKFGEKYGRGIGISSGQKYVIAPYMEQTSDSGKTIITPMNPFNGGIVIPNEYGNTITGKQDLLVTITKNTTQSQLEEYIKQMKAKGIELKFDNTDYNNGILVSISGNISSKDGKGNFVASDFSELVLSRMGVGDRTYFIVMARDNKRTVL
jgi:beta-lactamase regulating signal transducer with metallopeptidase domain